MLAAEFRDVAAAEDAVSDALVAALTHWPSQGIPQSPEGWLVTVARRRLLDDIRRRKPVGPLSSALLAGGSAQFSEAFAIPDRRLALLFVCSHPAIDAAARAPLILQTVLGFDAQQIAHAFLVSPKAMAQRLVRAKRKIRDAGVPFDLPCSKDIATRLEAVLDAVYACYAEGWSTPLHDSAGLHGLTQEAIWLARLLKALCPKEPEVIGLLALLLFIESRTQSRRTGGNAYIPLSLQDPAKWNEALIWEAESLLRLAFQQGTPGRFQLQAAIQSAHCGRKFSGVTDWKAIRLLYDALAKISTSPVIAINRAISVAEIEGPLQALEELKSWETDVRIREYQPYWAAMAHLLGRTGEKLRAQHAYGRAIALSTDPAVRSFLASEMVKHAGA